MVNPDLLEHLYSEIENDIVGTDGVLRRRYNGFRLGDLIKLFVLPYILNIPSERAIERILADNELVRCATGFGGYSNGDRLPSRATLWHFRNKHEGVYEKYLYKSLILVYTELIRTNESVPFVSNSTIYPNGKNINISIKSRGLTSKITTSKKSGQNIKHKSQIPLPFDKRDNRKEDVLRNEKLRMSQQLGLPATIKLRGLSDQDAVFNITEPSWHYENVLDFDRGLPSHPDRQNSMNIACNILVIRKDNKRREVLLAERVGGEFGRHKLAAPGGTVKLSDNSVFSTAQRELREETNLVAESMSDISPTSIKYTNYSGKPEYLSIGFFARFEELGGKLIGRESDLGEWKWYDINKVPDDIFDPTLTALNDFLDGKYKELTWSHVESEADKFKARGRTNGQNDRGDEDNSLFD